MASHPREGEFKEQVAKGLHQAETLVKQGKTVGSTDRTRKDLVQGGCRQVGWVCGWELSLGSCVLGAATSLCFVIITTSLPWPFLKKSISLDNGGFIFTGSTALIDIVSESLVAWLGDEPRENATINGALAGNSPSFLLLLSRACLVVSYKV